MIKVDMPKPRLPAVKCLITVLAFQVEGLPFMNHLYVLPEVQGLAKTLGTMITHEATLMPCLFMPNRREIGEICISGTVKYD